MDFEAKLETFYNQLQLIGTTVIDIGANIGRHAIPLAKRIGSAGVLYAFEPIPIIRSTLNANLLEAELNNVTVYPFALSSNRSVADFNYIPNLPEESGLKKRHIYNAVPSEFQKIKVGVFRLDDLIPINTKISFIKIDVEGGELDVLRGAPRLLASSRSIVAFECGAASFLGYHKTPGEIFEIFTDLDYQIFSIVGEKMISIEAFVAASYAQNCWDYVAIPHEQYQLSEYLNNN
jgi:FkbM family methyltransferase